MQFRCDNSRKPAADSNDIPVLCVGYAAETLDDRCRFLGKNGFAVSPARSRAQAVSLLGEKPYAALVIGHAIPEADRLEFIQRARAFNPQAIVVLLYRDSIRRAEAAQAVLSVQNGPLSLVQALNELLGK